MTTTDTNLDPSSWPDSDTILLTDGATDLRDLQPATGEFARAIVVGSTGPFGQVAGRHVLAAGGSAVDAAITTALTQIALAAGAWVSYAGIFHLIHFEAATGEVTSLSAGFGTFKGETDAATIPPPPQPSGRTALVPGFFAGINAAHARFGKLDWADLFAPAIHVADSGFRLNPGQAGAYEMRRDVLMRTPEGRAIFLDADGNLPTSGNVLRLPQLADTLRRVAAEGVDYIYRGEWAEHFVEAVNAEGGKASLEDLRDYQPIWAAPITGSFCGHDVYGPGLPDLGGVHLIEGLNLVQEAGLSDASSSPESLYWLIQITRQGGALSGLPPMTRIDPEHAQHVWKEMQAAGRFVGPSVVTGSHSDFVVTVDADGNCAAVCHSINTSMYGTTGIFVDGVSIPDAACFQQQVLATITPGDPLPHPMAPSIALRNGKPVLVSSSIGAGLQAVTLECVASVLGTGLSVKEAVSQPLFHASDLYSGDSINSAVEAKSIDDDDGEGPKGLLNGITSAVAAIQAAIERHIGAGVPPEDAMAAVIADVPEIVDDTFDPQLLAAVEALGQRVSARGVDDPTVPRGYWGGVTIDAETGALRGGRTPFVHGRVEGI